MSIDKIIVYEGMICLSGEFHSSAMDTAQATDHPLVRDTAGRFMLRGESFGGMIRRELVRYFGNQCQDYQDPDGSRFKSPCDCEVCRLMGHSRISKGGDPKEPAKGNEYRSSRLRVTGGVFANGHSRIRHGVAIERRFSVASAHKKHDVEALLTGAEAPFSLQIEDPSEEESWAMETLLTEMRLGLLSLGGRKGSGFGTFEIEYDKYVYELGKKDDAKRYLLREMPAASAVQENLQAFSPDTVASLVPFLSNGQGLRISFPFDLWFPELFLVNDPLESALLGSDHVSVVDGKGNPWLPPSTLRGVIRTRCEQILRTLHPAAACDPSNDKEGDPLRSCSSRIEAMKSKMNKKDEWPTWKELEAPDFLCMACQLFGCGHLGGRVRFQPGVYKENREHQNTLLHFLAIDRFKGGGKDGAKFDAWPMYDTFFSGCRIIVEDCEPWQIGLLAMALKDLMQADLHMGFGTRKGFGQAVGSIDRNASVLAGHGTNVYRFDIKSYFDPSTNVDAALGTALENAVMETRKRASEWKGAFNGYE